MNYCMNSKGWKIRRIALFLIILVMACLLVAAAVAVLVLYYKESQIVATIFAAFLALLGVWIFILWFSGYIKEGRKFCMDEEGITTSCLVHKNKFYPWSLFSSIVVCDFDHAPKNPENCYLIIRLSALHEPDGPNSKSPSRTFWGIEKWRDYEYTMANYDGIIFLGYSPELLDEVCRLSKLPVKFSLTKYGRKMMDKNKADGIWDR